MTGLVGAGTAGAGTVGVRIVREGWRVPGWCVLALVFLHCGTNLFVLAPIAQRGYVRGERGR